MELSKEQLKMICSSILIEDIKKYKEEQIYITFYFCRNIFIYIFSIVILSLCFLAISSNIFILYFVVPDS